MEQWRSVVGRVVLGMMLAANLLAIPGMAAEPAATAAEKTAEKTAEKKGEKKAKKPKKPAQPPFVRISRSEKGDVQSLDTSIVSYSPADGKNEGLVVDLVGAIHIGDKTYYEQLNKQFENYDVLLYELVAPQGTRIPKGQGKPRLDHPVGAMQGGMQSMLDLAFQLEEIDYTKGNFVHADMSPDEFAKNMKDRGEGWLQMFFKMMGAGMAMQAKNPEKYNDFAIIGALFAPDRSHRLKLILADQMSEMDTTMAALDGPEGSSILTERNKKAFEVLKQQIAAGKKKIGVFYGAAHLPDMERRLQSEFGLKRGAEKWVVAWNLEKKEKSKEKEPAKAPKGN